MEHICSKQTRSKPRIVKYSKNLFKPAVRDNLSHRIIQAVKYNLSHLTNFHSIDCSWGQIYREENSYLK
jgi:hypothetical protein